MKKNYLTLFLVIIGFIANSYAQADKKVHNHALGQSVFIDAQTIAANGAKRDEILRNYFNSNKEIDTFNAKGYGISVDHFTVEPSSEILRGMSLASVQGDFGLGAIGDPTTAIDALASVIAERFKQEVNIAFLKKFKDELDKEPYLGLLFPESKTVLMTSDPYNYPVFMNALQDAFKEDVDNLIKNLPAVIKEISPNDAKLQSLTSLLELLGDTNATGNLIAKFNNLANNYKGNDADFKMVLDVMALSLNAVNKGGTGKAMFINLDDIDNFSNDVFSKHYFALLIRQNEKYLAELGITNVADTKWANFIKDIVPVFKTLADQANTINSQNAQNTLTSKTVLESASTILVSVKKATDIYKKYIDVSFNITKFDSVYTDAASAVKIARFIADKKYGLALVELTQFIGELKGNPDDESFSLFKKYMGFVGNALAAQDKQQLMDALDTSAMPVGSYRVKRNTTFDVAINAYAGGFVGTDFGSKAAYVYGFTAPVGIYLGFGNIWKKFSENPLKDVDGKSLGVFFSVIDVGAVTAFRLQDNSTEMADVTWNNVFAPGAYLSFGLGKCPVSLNLGGQMGPELTKINADGTPEFVTKEWYWRFGAVIDIPLYNLFSKQRSYTLRKKKNEDKEAKDEIDLRNKERAKKSAKK